ncbi:hypothetical protein HKD21_04170 [Gluconobacter cerevisiae]|uniref:Uncharacterized protein n=1 Tax=Gluconobacter cerevisiae TaxID=1379734 RepID=A0ABR9YBM5_9PROT|nr:hypothetical protein [Gluconobacter cerevisiae]MBF0876045.1 hypothetical protein [Gluconobacter cerevisiae]
MANIDRSIFRLPFIGGAVAVLLVLGAGGAFLRLGMTATPPQQTMVHKDLSGAAFASSAAPQAELPAMPPVPTAQNAVQTTAQTPAAPVVASGTTPAVPAAPPTAAPLTPSTPLPTMPAPKAAPTQSVPAAPVAPASASGH